jgi:ABC-type polysaccharide/polyol phosphate export permease
MSIWGALAGGFVGTLVLTSGMQLATQLRLTRIDLPFLLGTALTSDRQRAAALGYLLHFVAGLIFAIAYYLVFEAIGESSWWLGAAFGFLHAVFAGTALVNVLLPIVHPRMATVQTAANSSPRLEPPGFLLLNYGKSTPLVMVALHIVYGAIVGEFAALSG